MAMERRTVPGGGGGEPEDAGSSTRHRRSRSLSRYSGRYPRPLAEPGEDCHPRSGFPETSLDDLADEFFRAKYKEAAEEEERRLGRRRMSEVSPRMVEGRRGRSVSRNNASVVVEKKGMLENGGGSKGISDGRARRQRSVSVARHRCSDSENDIHFSHSSNSQAKLRSLGNRNFQQPSFCRPTTSSLLRRSASQKDLLQSHDNYSQDEDEKTSHKKEKEAPDWSHSSSITDDEARTIHTTRGGTRKSIRTVYAKKTMHAVEDGEGPGLYEGMPKQVRRAVDEIRMELEKSEKRRQDLLAELAVEERGHELTKTVREFLPAPKQTAAPKRSLRPRRRSKDRNRTSKCLTEDAEKYFENFLSNVEDTDISSYDGERSDNGSTIGGSTKFKDSLIHTVPEALGNLTPAVSLPAEADGVVLPWLQWETSNNASPSPCKSKTGPPGILGKNLFSPVQEMSTAYDSINRILSSYGSWSPEGSCAASRDITSSRLSNVRNLMNNCSISKPKGTSFNMDEYAHLQSSDDLIFEVWRQRQRIESGSFLLCGRPYI